MNGGRTRDMTRGEPTRLLILFLLPILAGNILQEAYSLVDSAIIGQVCGVEALTAVSASGWFDWMVLSIMIGLTQGFSIQAAQDFGAGHYPQLRRTVGQSLLLSLFTVAILEFASQLFLRQIIRLVRTPEEIFELEVTYLRILFVGIPLVMGHNLLGGFLRSVGNSKAPLAAMILSTLTNAVLDWTFVAGYGWGVAGAALATVIAQGISCLVCLLAYMRLPILHPASDDMRPYGLLQRKLLFLGAPLAFANVVISVGGLFLQSVVNGFGYLFAAGYNTASRLQGPIEIAGNSIGAATSTFVGQNYGAGKMDRVRDGLRKSLIMALLVSLLIMFIVLSFGRSILLVFLNDSPEVVDQVLSYAVRFLQILGYGVPALYVLFVYRYSLQGLGDSMIPMIAGFVELVSRIAAALVLPQYIGVTGVFLAEILAWINAAILLVIGYYYRIHRISRMGHL